MGVHLNFSPADLQRTGPLLQVMVSHTKFELEEARSLGFEFPNLLPVHALIDTGASVTIVNPVLAKTFKLKPTGQALIKAAGHTDIYPEYAASISFPNRNLRDFDVLRIVACPLASAEISCLIGRDILRHWKFDYNGQSGEVTILDLRA